MEEFKEIAKSLKDITYPPQLSKSEDKTSKQITLSNKFYEKEVEDDKLTVKRLTPILENNFRNHGYSWEELANILLKNYEMKEK